MQDTCQFKSNQNKRVQAIEVTKDVQNIFIKTAFINDVKFKCLLDSGSDCTVHSIKIINRT